MLIEIVGTAGACLLLLSYFLVSSGHISLENTLGHLLNFGGAVMLGVNAFAHHALPPAALNVLWALIAIAALVKQLRARPAPADRPDV